MFRLGLGLGLGLRPENAGLGLGLGLETSGLGLGLVPPGLVNITACNCTILESRDGQIPQSIGAYSYLFIRLEVSCQLLL